MRNSTREKLIIASIAVATVIVLVFLFVMVGKESAARQERCADLDGTLTSDTKTMTTVTTGTNGQPVVGTASSTTYFCLSADGRVLFVD